MGSSGASGGGSGALTQISRTVLTASTAPPVTFTAIPAGYENLIVKITGASTRSANGDYITLQINGDTATNYAHQFLQGNVTTASAGQTTSETVALIGYLAQTGNAASAISLQIGSYARTTLYKTGSSISASSLTPNLFAHLFAFEWRSTAAITSLSFGSNGGFNFGPSVWTLYGES